jgi:ankyrin repeat protein
MVLMSVLSMQTRRNVFHHACEGINRLFIDIFKLLIKFGADIINTTDYEVNTPPDFIMLL